VVWEGGTEGDDAGKALMYCQCVSFKYVTFVASFSTGVSVSCTALSFLFCLIKADTNFIKYYHDS